VDQCCHLGQQTLLWLPTEEDTPVRDALLRWLVVFPRTLMCQVREDTNLKQEIAGWVARQGLLHGRLCLMWAGAATNAAS
jgi:hypothetical protein